MFEEYDDIREAYSRAQFLNKIEGRANKYCVTGSVDGWAVRLRSALMTPVVPASRALH